VAIISTYNEADVIDCVLRHLVENGVEVYVIDNHSNDGTADSVARWLGRGVIGMESFPADREAPAFVWQGILERKLALAAELGADWYIHHDADEIRHGPWPDQTLAESIAWVDRLGFNAIDFRILEFHPVDDGFEPGSDVRTYFSRWGEPAEYDRIQIKAWKAGLDASFVDGGHEVAFEGRRVFPIRFVTRHYPIRGQRHGLRKVLVERKGRFTQAERERGWHVQYDMVSGEEHVFLRNPASLRPFDLDRTRLEVQLESSASPPAPQPGATTEPAGHQGFLEAALASEIVGWAWDRTRGDETILVDVWAGSRRLGSVPARDFRPDLEAEGKGDGRHGFRFTPPPDLVNGRPQSIWVNVAGTDIALAGCPKALS
jgi:hypothetical protein